MARRRNKQTSGTARVVNRRARHEFEILETLEVGIALTGSEVKSARQGKVSLAEGYVVATETPLALTLLNVHIAEYPPAGANQHQPARPRVLLAHRREIRHLARASAVKGVTIVPLELRFVRGWAKLVIALARGKSKVDKRRSIRERETRREIERALSRKA